MLWFTDPKPAGSWRLDLCYAFGDLAKYASGMKAAIRASHPTLE